MLTRNSRSGAAIARLLIAMVMIASALAVTTAVQPAAANGGAALIGVGGNCLDVPYANTNLGTDLWMWDCNGTAAQQFTIRNGRIEVMGKCLDVEGPLRTRGTPAQIWDCQNVSQHRWTITDAGEIISQFNGLCLDVSGGSTSRRAKVQLWDCNGSAAQQWYAYDSRYNQNYTRHLYVHTYQLALSASETRQVNQIFQTDPNQFFPFTVDPRACRDCSKPMGIGNILKLDGQYSIGEVMVVDSHSTGWKFLALPGHIAQGGTVEFTLIHSSDTYDPNDRGAFLTVRGSGRGGIEANSPTWFAERVGLATWSRMAAAINCWDHRQDNPNASC